MINSTFLILSLVALVFLQPSTIAGLELVNVTIPRNGVLTGFVHQLPPDENISHQPKINVFLGVPFAEPPVRFEKPVAAKWKGHRNALEYAPSCYQSSSTLLAKGTKYSEDCLHLNIYTPSRSKNEKRLFPVAFLIHGGGMQTGSAMDSGDYNWFGVKYVAKGIIIVGIQYRLGLWGFAGNGKDEMPGNYALWDQTMALRWVHKNIRDFGGDPKRVTAFAYSAGSISVGLLSHAPHSRNYFQQAIRMSGSVSAGGMAGRLVANETASLAAAVNCSSSIAMKKCLQSKTIDELYGGFEKMGPLRTDFTHQKFVPNQLDQHFFPGGYEQLVASTPKKRFIHGFTEMEFLFFSQNFAKNDSSNSLALSDEQIDQMDADAVKAFIRDWIVQEQWFGKYTEAARKDVFDFYEQWATKTGINDGVKNNTFYVWIRCQILSDLIMGMPTLRDTQKWIESGSTVFLYNNYYFNPEIFEGQKHMPVHANHHVLDFMFVKNNSTTAAINFRGVKVRIIRNEMDRKIRDTTIDFTVNFIKTGNPSSQKLKWTPTKKYSIASGKPIPYLHIDAPEATMAKGPAKGTMNRLKFWSQMAAKYPFDLVAYAPTKL